MYKITINGKPSREEDAYVRANGPVIDEPAMKIIVFDILVRLGAKGLPFYIGESRTRPGNYRIPLPDNGTEILVEKLS